ncbi:Scr1 family TA system antitoxin-like transcriptional regulator [Kitasatospora sp. NPDC101183]|uniref:helix-turn-helix domain-containing protein n=1 Tax=Kitasatospora sp. NPDC101183 TaxID=3364100 RepID=UPI00381AE4B2
MMASRQLRSEASELTKTTEVQKGKPVRVRRLDPSSSPYAPLGVQLRRSREAKGLTQDELGAKIKFSGSYISRIERGIVPPSRAFAEAVDQALETGGTISLMLDQLNHGALKEGFPEYAAKESEAVAIRLFHLGLISGLLQTEEYAAAYEQALVSRGTATQQQADSRVQYLLARQARLTRTPAPFVHVVIDEWNLRRPIGGPAVMARQLRHLERLAEQPNVTIQVAPISLGEARPFAHTVTLLTMPNGKLLGYTESHKTGYLERDARILSEWTRDYDRLQVEALNQSGSIGRISLVRKEFEDEC